MSITINRTPKKYSGSENPNNIVVSSTKATELGFKFKIEYYSIDNNLLFKPIYLVPSNTSNGEVMFDLHRLMNSFIKLDKHIILNTMMVPNTQSFRYYTKITETYIKGYTMNEYYWIQPYASNNQTVIECYNHPFIVGDTIRIEDVTVTASTEALEDKIEDAYNGIFTVVGVIDNNRFIIDTPFAGSGELQTGTIYYNDNRIEEFADKSTDNITITYGYSNYQQLYTPTSMWYENDYTTQLQSAYPNFRMVNIFGLSIYKWQYFYVNLFEDGGNVVRRLKFTDGVNQDIVNVNNTSALNKQVLINPNLWSQITNDYNNDYTVYLLDIDNQEIASYKVKIKMHNCLYKNQIFFYDHKGSLATLPFTRRLNKDLAINHSGHRIYTDYTNDFYLNTENNFSTTLNIGEDWMNYNEYMYLEDLFTSPYHWILFEDETIPRPIEIVDKTLSLMDNRQTKRYKADLKIKLMK